MILLSKALNVMDDDCWCLCWFVWDSENLFDFLAPAVHRA